MGNIKTSFIKNIGERLYRRYEDKFTEDFSKNKELVNELINIRSKSLRNKIAGYITNLKGRRRG